MKTVAKPKLTHFELQQHFLSQEWGVIFSVKLGRLSGYNQLFRKGHHLLLKQGSLEYFITARGVPDDRSVVLVSLCGLVIARRF